MNALIKKEIRLLLPAWIAAMVLAIVPVWLVGKFDNRAIFDFPPAFCLLLGIIFLGIASFGQEFSYRTFPVQLAQPISRNLLWRVKVIVLVLALVFVLLTAMISWALWPWPHNSLLDNFKIASFGALILFSGGLWTTLLLRQIVAAFWLTLLIPVSIALSIGLLSDYYHWPGAIGDGVLIAYSLTGFFWARHLFLNAQDTRWTGGEISFSWRRKISARTLTSSQPRHWLSALVRKEFQLHQVNILIAVLVLVLHLASVVVRKVHPHFTNTAYKDLLEFVWSLWLLMPLPIGCAAVAEERKLGIVESQLCLPVSRRVQLFIKFSVGLVLSLILGGLMPFIIERPHDFNHWIFVAAAVIFFISFYASTLARTTLQAIGLAIAVAAAIYFYEVATAVSIFKIGEFLPAEKGGIELLKLFLGVPILIIVFGRLIFWNFKWLHENWKLWRRNLVVVLAAFATIFILSNAIYFRAWELLTPIEPPHGAARLSFSKPPKLLTSYNAISALLPDGRLWSEQTDSSSFGRIVPRMNTQRFVGDSNWTDAASDGFRVVEIQSDGSLWSFQTYGDWLGPLYPLTQIGSDKDWLRVAGGHGFLLLKNDGTLWTWGVGNQGTIYSDKLKKYLATSPQRLDGGTNWTSVFSYDHNSVPFARKNNGSIWVRQWGAKSMVHLHQLESWQLPNKGFVSLTSMGEMTAGIKTNGELWLIVDQQNQKRRKIQIGQNEKWKAAGVLGNSLIALRSDGTLWKWSGLWSLVQNPNSAKAVQLGNHSDWIALFSRWYSGAFALAADGSLWIWENPSEYRWLAPSRKPVFIGNIFQGKNSP